MQWLNSKRFRCLHALFILSFFDNKNRILMYYFFDLELILKIINIKSAKRTHFDRGIAQYSHTLFFVDQSH